MAMRSSRFVMIEKDGGRYTMPRNSLGMEDGDTQAVLKCEVVGDTLMINMVYDILGGDNNLKKLYTPVSSAPDFITGPLYTVLSLECHEVVGGLGRKISGSSAWVVVEREELKLKPVPSTNEKE